MQCPSCHHVMVQCHDDKHFFIFHVHNIHVLVQAYSANIAILSNKQKRLRQKHQVHHAKSLQTGTSTFLSTFGFATMQY